MSDHATVFYELLAAELIHAGIDTVFTFTSEDVARFVAVLEREGVAVHLTRHEHVAVGMADGYSRASGKLGVAIVGRGPGLTNAINALLNATKARSEVLVLCGEWGADQVGDSAPAPTGGGALKLLDQRALLRALHVRHIVLEPADRALDQLAVCIAEARQGGVVVAAIPVEVLEAKMTPPRRAPAPASPAPATPSPESIAEVADLLEATFAARRPVILAGRGAVRAGARAELLRLGDLIGALMGTTLRARSFFARSPHDLGVIGTFASPLASELVAGADLVLAFGASLNDFTTYQGTLLKKAQVVQFDSDAGAIGSQHAVALGVCGDALLAARSVADELERRRHRSEGYRLPGTLARIAGGQPEESTPDRGTSGALDPRKLFPALDRVLPRDRMVVADAGVSAYNGVKYLSVASPDAFAWTVDYGAIGCGLGLALGAAVARPERLTVLAIGDAGLMMTLADLDTAVRYQLPLLVLLGDDGAVGAELLHLQRSGLPEATARFANPDFAAVARALGASAVSINSLGDVALVARRLQGLRGPLVVHCRVMTWRDMPATT